MREESVEIATPDGKADGSLYGEGPGVLYYPHGLGVDEGFHIMAKRLAGDGYCVLMPNIYYRHMKAGPAFAEPVDFADPKVRERFRELSGALTLEAMARDALAYLDFLGGEVKGQVAAVGYCLTGKMTMRTAAAAPDRIACAASFHGGGLYTDDASSPHLLLPRITARLYFGHATNDQGMTADAIAKFEAALAAWGGRYESETYPALHGWTVPGGRVYDHAQAERHYAKLTELLERTLR